MRRNGRNERLNSIKIIPYRGLNNYSYLDMVSIVSMLDRRKLKKTPAPNFMINFFDNFLKMQLFLVNHGLRYKPKFDPT